MQSTRRALLGTVASGVTVGCVTDGPGDVGTLSPDSGNGGSTPTRDSGTTSPVPTSCDPDDVSRPPIVEDANHSAMGYGTKPQELTVQSVADYLVDFETAYAWNRILAEHAPVSNIGVDTTTAWTPEPAGEGYLASSRIETSYAKDGSDEPTRRSYVASYFVSAEPVYRVEADTEAVDPRTHPDRELVQCGPDTKK